MVLVKQGLILYKMMADIYYTMAAVAYINVLVANT